MGPVTSLVVYVLVLCLCICILPFPQAETSRRRLAIWMKKTVMMLTGRKRESRKEQPARAMTSSHPKSWYMHFSVTDIHYHTSQLPSYELIKCSTAFWSSMGSLICMCFIHPCFWTANFIKSTKGWVRSQHHPPGRPLHNPYSLCEYSLMTQSYTGSKRIKVLIISIKPLVLSTTNDVCQSALACKF